MKYIDADRLRAEIESRKEAILSFPENEIVTSEAKSAIRSMAKGLLSFIDSLQQEQPETNFEKEIEEHAIYMPHGEFASDNEIIEDMEWARKEFRHFYELGRQANPEVFDTVAFQKGVQEGRRLEREDALTIADIEKLHTFLCAVKNNKQGAFTFTRLSDEQYEEVLRRFNNAKEK